MKFKILSVVHTYGNSRESGNAYSMHRVLALSPFVPVHQGKAGEKGWFNREGAGFSTVELPVSEDFYPRLLACFRHHVKGGVLEWDFDTFVQQRGRGTEVVLSGFVVDPGIDGVSVDSSTGEVLHDKSEASVNSSSNVPSFKKHG